MFRNRVRWNAFVAILLLSPLASAFAFADVNREAIREKTQLYWDAIRTFEVKGEEYVCDEEGNRSSKVKSSMDFEYAFSADGRRELKLVANGADNKKTILTWFRGDNKTTYMISPFGDDLKTVKYVQVKKSDNSPDQLRTAMCSYIWMITPRGHKVSDLLSKGGTLGPVEHPQGLSAIEYKTEDDGVQIRMRLISEYDYLPDKIWMDDSEIYETTRFTRINGLWFPQEICKTVFRDEKVAFRKMIKATDIRANHTIAAARFQLPALEPGAVILDDTAKGKSRIVGANKKDLRSTLELPGQLAAKHNEEDKNKNDSEDQKTSNTIVASRDPERGVIAGYLFYASACILIVSIAIGLKYAISAR